MAMTIPIKPGQPVSVAGRLHEITRVVGFDAVLARDQETGELRKVAIADLELPIEAARDGEGERRPDLAAIPQKDWDIAEKKFEIIKPLLGKAGRTAADVEGRARAASVDRSTVYRWLDTYERSGLLSSLLLPDRTGSREKRLDEEVEAIVKDAIKNRDLTKRKLSVMKT